MIKEFEPTGFSAEIFRQRYSITPEETWQEACRRVARQMALAEIPEKQKDYEEKFYSVLVSNLFVPGGRVWYGSGKNNPNLINCFVINGGKDLDSKEGWGNAAYEMIVTSMSGGGVGCDFSGVRPNGALISNNKGICPGPVSLMELIDSCAEPVRAGGGRRAALMFSLDLEHPDIEQFLDAKLTKGKLTHANVSVRSNYTDSFIKAVRKDKPLELSWDGKYKREVSARKIWNQIVENAWKSAEPGFLNWELVNNENTIYYVGDLQTTNPCTTGDTLILTKSGYHPIKNLTENEIEIWNGNEWSSVKPFSTGKNPTVNVYLSDGSSLRCTPYHKFILQEGWSRGGKQYRKEAISLKVGDKLAKFSMPVVVEGGTNYPTDAYSQGFYAGDGTSGYSYSYLYSTKYCCEDRLTGKVSEKPLAFGRKKWYHGPMLDKDFVPVNGTFDYRMNWLEGLLDSDGTVTRDKNGNGFQICSVNEKFLQDTKLLLTTLGVQAKIVKGRDAEPKLMPDHNGGSKLYNCQKYWRLLIGNQDAWHLMELGLSLCRLKHNGQKPQRDARQFVKVVAIDNDEDCETFCFTDQKNNSGTFNGIVTANCGEIPMMSYENCCLGHLVLSRFILEDGKVDYATLGETVRTAVRFLDNVLSVNHFPLPEMKEKADKLRRIGLGVTGLADMLALAGLKYGSEDANYFVDHLFRFISKQAYEASVFLAVEKGPFALCNKEKHVEGGYVKRMTTKIKNLIREHGIRNCAILTNAPTGTVSILSGNCSSGVEPIFAPAYERRYWVGSDRKTELVFHPLFKHLYDRGLDVSHLIASHELTVREHLEVQKVIQRHIDNAISKTINIPEDYPIEGLSEVWLEYLPHLKGTTFYRVNSRGYVDEQGVTHEPPLRALSLSEAIEKSKQADGSEQQEVILVDDCPKGICEV